MPPAGRDDQLHALHVLNVLVAAKALVAAIARTGGRLPEATDAETEAMRVLYEETSKLQVFETRARARGTLQAFTDEQLAEAIQNLRASKILSAGEQSVLESTAKDDAEAFSLAAEPETKAATDAPSTASSSDDDAFSL